jgi:hypothetical protein
MKGNVTLWTARLKPRYVKIDVDFDSVPEGEAFSRHASGFAGIGPRRAGLASKRRPRYCAPTAQTLWLIIPGC